MEIIEHELNTLIEKLIGSENFQSELENLQSVYPFNKMKKYLVE